LSRRAAINSSWTQIRAFLLSVDGRFLPGIGAPHLCVASYIRSTSARAAVACLRGPRAKEGLKAVFSVLLAVGVATVFNLDDLSWAAFSGYMVMRGSIVETIPRGLM
jgi:hypothetical protein